MRSSKSRSRSKNNRNRSMGNVVNRVFDSSGPEGKVRGTPQQIIDKYNQLARDAQLSNDRVAAENFQQHAEHYLRMLAEAQKEQAERQAQQQAQQQDRQRNQNSGNGSGQNQPANADQPRQDAPAQEAKQPQAQPSEPQKSTSSDVMDVAGSDEASPLVETPESAPSKPRRPRRKPAEAAPVQEQPSETPDAAE
ncbi:MAG: DUF4167 domain-containing protein [Pseudomonadota bacterium]